MKGSLAKAARVFDALRIKLEMSEVSEPAPIDAVAEVSEPATIDAVSEVPAEAVTTDVIEVTAVTEELTPSTEEKE